MMKIKKMKMENLYFKIAVQIMRDVFANHNLQNVDYHNIKAINCISYIFKYLKIILMNRSKIFLLMMIKIITMLKII